MHIEGSPVIARCVLDNQDPPSEIAYLTVDGFVVTQKGRPSDLFLKENIKGLRIRHRILWLPLVIGGIITPLALVALIKTFGAFWLLLALTLAGIFLMYFGYTGRDALTVSTNVKDYDFFINLVTPYIRAFVHFSNLQLRNDDPNIYVAASTEQLQHNNAQFDEGTRIYFDRHRIPPSEFIMFLNARENEVVLKYSYSEETDEVQTFLQKALPVGLFQKVE